MTSQPTSASSTARTLTGMALMVAAMVVAPGLDVVAKLLMARLSPLDVGFGRFLAQTLVLLPLALALRQWCAPRRSHLLAGLCLGGALLCLNLALREMPVANTLAIFFVEPLILTVLAALVLGERLGQRRLAAMLVGLCGVGLVLRPNLGAYGWAACWPLGAAFLFAVYLLVLRAVRQRGRALAVQFWIGAVAAVALGLALLGEQMLSPRPLPPLGTTEYALFALLGLLAALSHQLIAHALARAEAGALAPLQYLEILSASLLGWLVFAEFPDALTWAGTAVIVGAGLTVFQAERRPA